MSLHVMADKMAFILVRKEIIKEDKLEIYSYGLEILIAAVINGALVISASLLLGVFWQTVLLLIPFMLIRRNAGGFHAKTHMGCMLGFLSVYLVSIFGVRWFSQDMVKTIMLISLPAAAAVIFRVGALPHKNRPVSSRELSHFKTKSRLLTCCLALNGLTGLFLAPAWFVYFALGIYIAAGSLTAGYVQAKCARRCKSWR